MTDKDRNTSDEALQDEVQAEAVAAEEPDAGDTAGEPEMVEDSEAAEIDRLQREVLELKERLLRQQAEFDNTRKRLRRDMEEAGNRALVRFIRPMLPELDNFELAIQAANPEAFQEFAMGVSMIKNNIDNILSGVGIQPIPTEGVFDPARHEVVQEIESDQPKGTIVEVFRTGYQLGGQVIRAAQVMVAKPTAAAEADAAEGSADEADAEDPAGS